MKNYTLLPESWDYSHQDEVKDLMKEKIYTPSQHEGVRDRCGWIGCLTKSQAIDYGKQAKKDFPFVEFHLYEGNTFGSLKFVQSF